MAIQQILLAQGGAVADNWVTAAQWTKEAGSGASWGGFTFRVVVPTSALVAGSKIRLTCQSSDTSGCTISAMYVGAAAASGDDYDFATTPTPVLFSGSASAAIGAASSLVSDPTTFTVDASKPLIISTYMSVAGRTANITTLAGWVTRYKSGNDAATVNATGYSTSAYAANFVTKIEVLVP